MKSEKQGKDRAGMAQQGLGKNWAAPVRTEQPPPYTQVPQSRRKVCGVTVETAVPGAPGACSQHLKSQQVVSVNQHELLPLLLQM